MSPEPPSAAEDDDSPLWRVSARARGDDAEELRARFLSLAPRGIEEATFGDEIEVALYATGGDVERIRAALPHTSIRAVDRAWEDAWRTFHRPVEIAGLWLGPPWEAPPEPGRAVVIDPGRAFGTGAHPTTRLCVELLARTAERGSLLDVGCGSGVLGIAAARLGFRRVLCVDVDPVAVATTRANAAANGVSVEARVVDAEREALPPADAAVANVLLEPVERILTRLSAREAITSGYLDGQRPAHAGWTHVETAAHDGWAADRFVRR